MATKGTTKKKAPAKPKAAASAYGFGQEDIERERDTNQLSWAKVAAALNLKSPSAARSAYTELTGRPHDTSVLAGVTRAPKEPGAAPARRTSSRQATSIQDIDTNPHWNVDSDQDEMIEKLTPHFDDKGKAMYVPVITVKRASGYEEQIGIINLIGFSFDKKEEHLCVELHDAYNGGYRCLRVDEIISVI